MQLPKKAVMLILVGELERRGHICKMDGYYLEITNGCSSRYAAIVNVGNLLDSAGTPDLLSIGYQCREIEQQLKDIENYEYH